MNNLFWKVFGCWQICEKLSIIANFLDFLVVHFCSNVLFPSVTEVVLHWFWGLKSYLDEKNLQFFTRQISIAIPHETFACKLTPLS
jgi:hypothetical protein